MPAIDKRPPSLRLVLLVAIATMAMLTIMPAWFDLTAAIAGAVSWCMWLEKIEQPHDELATESRADESVVIRSA